MTEVRERKNRLLLDLSIGRYEVVALAKKWMSVLQKSDDCKNMGHSEIVKQSLDDIISGAVNDSDIEKAIAAMPASKHSSEESEKEIKHDAFHYEEKLVTKNEKHKKQ